jgi:hypothetical protein
LNRAGGRKNLNSREKAKKLHSDLGSSDAAMAELNAACAKLKEQAA